MLVRARRRSACSRLAFRKALLLKSDRVIMLDDADGCGCPLEKSEGDIDVRVAPIPWGDKQTLLSRRSRNTHSPLIPSHPSPSITVAVNAPCVDGV